MFRNEKLKMAVVEVLGLICGLSEIDLPISELVQCKAFKILASLLPMYKQEIISYNLGPSLLSLETND